MNKINVAIREKTTLCPLRCGADERHNISIYNVDANQPRVCVYIYGVVVTKLNRRDSSYQNSNYVLSSFIMMCLMLRLETPNDMDKLT